MDRCRVSRLERFCGFVFFFNTGTGPDPGTDFRGAGMFGLVHLLYFASHFGNEFRQSLKSGYPVSVAGLNVTMGIYQVHIFGSSLGFPQLLQLLGWGFKKVEVSATTKRTLVEYLFCDDRVLEEERFERLYCEAMLLLDREWKRQNATYMQFPMVLAKAQVLGCLCLIFAWFDFLFVKETFVKTLPEIVERLRVARPVAQQRPDLIQF
jgi:hypothetical protein